MPVADGDVARGSNFNRQMGVTTKLKEDKVMALNMEKIKQKQQELNKKGGAFWRPSKGVNRIRVFKFQHKVTPDEVKVGAYSPKEAGKTVEELNREVLLQFGIHPKKMPILATEESLEVYRELKNKDKDTAATIRPSKVFFLNIVDVLNPEKQVVLYGAKKTVFAEILRYLEDPDYGEEILGCKGDDFIVEYDPTAPGASMYSVRIAKEGKSEVLPSSLEKDVKDLLLCSDETFGAAVTEEMLEVFKDSEGTQSNGNGKTKTQGEDDEDPFEVSKANKRGKK